MDWIGVHVFIVNDVGYAADLVGVLHVVAAALVVVVIHVVAATIVVAVYMLLLLLMPHYLVFYI